jgi:hypothetical protein
MEGGRKAEHPVAIAAPGAPHQEYAAGVVSRSLLTDPPSS